jgi:hypothetical protein
MVASEDVIDQLTERLDAALVRAEAAESALARERDRAQRLTALCDSLRGERAELVEPAAETLATPRGFVP